MTRYAPRKFVLSIRLVDQEVVSRDHTEFCFCVGTQIAQNVAKGVWFSF